MKTQLATSIIAATFAMAANASDDDKAPKHSLHCYDEASERQASFVNRFENGKPSRGRMILNNKNGVVFQSFQPIDSEKARTAAQAFCDANIPPKHADISIPEYPGESERHLCFSEDRTRRGAFLGRIEEGKRKAFIMLSEWPLEKYISHPLHPLPKGVELVREGNVEVSRFPNFKIKLSDAVHQYCLDGTVPSPEELKP